MSVLLKLREYKQLPNSENEVRMYILKNSDEVIKMSIQELASKSFTSPPTVMRLCKRLGLQGFSDLKIEVASELKTFETMNINILDNATFKKTDTVKDIVNKITDITVKSIEETSLLADEKVLYEVAKGIMKADVIDFYGVGASNNIAFDAAFKFMRIGKIIGCLSLIDRQKIQAINSNKNHFAVLISYSGETKEILEIADILQNNNVPSVSITSRTENKLMNKTLYNLFVTSKESNLRNGAIASRTATLYMVDLLYTTCISLDFDNFFEMLKKTLTITK